MVDCDECKEKNMVAGQAFSSWTCQGCNKAFMHANTAVPKLCEMCAIKNKACEHCGGDLFVNNL